VIAKGQNRFKPSEANLIIFARNLKLMGELEQEVDLDIEYYPPTLIIPRERFATTTVMTVPKSS
jgi:hypothetical protein